MISLLHAADLHLDSLFSGLPEELARSLREQQRLLPGRIVDLANQRGCSLLLLAGDVFDQPTPAPQTVEALRRALARFRGRVFLSPGNHDPFGPLWADTVWPENVHIFSGGAQWVSLPELSCTVWGGGFTGPECAEALPQAGEDETIRIGVFHGDPVTVGPYRPISRQELESCGLHYLALGHIHTTQLPQRAGGTWYGWPGVPMGRGFDECGPHGVFFVQVSRDELTCELCPLDGPRFERLSMVWGQEPPLPPEAGQVLCRLTVTGEVDAPDFPALRRTLEERFLWLDLRDETTPVRDLWSACGDGTLRGLALDALRGRGEVGELAARYLLAALEGGEEP